MDTVFTPQEVVALYIYTDIYIYIITYIYISIVD